MLALLLEERTILRTLLPQESEVQNEKNISHDGASCKQPAIQEGVESNDVERNRQEQERCKSRTLRP